MQWVEFLTDNQIAYVTRGPNTKRGEVSVRCPWCSEDDPSEHLGINLASDAWGCLRNPMHRGKKPLYLISGLLGCSTSAARQVLAQYSTSDPESLAEVMAAFAETPEAPKNDEPLKLPSDFRLVTSIGSGRRFYNYLLNRGFHNPHNLATNYKLRFCTTGRWKDRIITPIYQNGKLVAWTGRAINKTTTAPRYLSTSNRIKSALFNEDDIFLGGRVLFVTEGPMDAMKVDYYSPSRNVRATCVFGTSITIDQIAILKQLSHKYKRVILLFDPEAIETAFSMSDWLPQAAIGQLPFGVEDPGALSREQVIELVHSV